MNTESTKNLVEENGVITLKADTTEGPIDEIHALMDELGNSGHGIPFLAIYPAGGAEPITVAGPTTQDTVLAALEKAGSSKVEGTQVPVGAAQDMR